MKKWFIIISLLVSISALSAPKIDKAQADSALFVLLSSDMSAEELNIPKTATLERNGRARGSVFMVKGSFFQVKSLRNDVYYITGRNKALPINDSRYPMETMNNLLLGVIAGGNRDVTVHHHQYGGQNATLYMPYDELRTKLEPGMKVYCSITSVTQSVVEGVAVYHDVKKNIIHMLQVSSPIATITTGVGEMEVELYSNIPQENISNLFGVEDELDSPVINTFKRK